MLVIKNKTLMTLLVLMSAFFCAWAIKVRSPINRPDNALSDTVTAWYENNYSAPVASSDWYLDAELDPNYVPVPGKDEVYMVLDSSGNIIKYRQRKQQADGSWVWSDYLEESSGIEQVEGKDGLYLMTDKDGNQKYTKYVRNDDNTYCFVETNADGIPLDIGTDAGTIGPNYVHLDKNIYGKYNDEGVLEGYRERVQQTDGSFMWQLADAPSLPSMGTGYGIGIFMTYIYVVGGNGGNGQFGGGYGSNAIVVEGVPADGEVQRIENADGTYTVTQHIINTETVNGQKVTTEVTVTKTYDANGDIISSISSEPTEVAREDLKTSEQPDEAVTASGIQEESARVSSSFIYDTKKSQDILSLLNAERGKQGAPQLRLDTSGLAHTIATIKAGDMAAYDYAAQDSPLYGSMRDFLAKYAIKVDAEPAMNVMKSSAISAENAHMKFQSDTESRTKRMSPTYTTVGIAAVEEDGMNYIAEVYM